MCISFSNTTFAYADNENISSSAEASKVNWWKIGWIILSDYVEKLIDLDGQSEKDSSWAYLVSPSIEYNTGDMGPEVYFRPEVDNSVGLSVCMDIGLSLSIFLHRLHSSCQMPLVIR
mgnify:CR=1 FL=1